MGVIVKPNLIVDDIKLPIKENDESAAKRILDVWGQNMPVIKINDYVLSAGEVKEFKLSIQHNKIPSFFIMLDDDRYLIRKTLKKELIDKIIIFIGYKDWYLKFNGIVLNMPSDVGTDIIYIIGEFYNEKLYECKQKAYNKKNVSDIVKDICETTKMGLFTYNNLSLNNIIDNCINTGKKQIDFIDEIIKKYTNNIWCLDTFGYFHISNIETLRKQPIDKYKIFEGKINDDEKDIIITTNKFSSEENKTEIEKFSVKQYTITTSVGKNHIKNDNEYEVKSDKENKKILSNVNIGISKHTKNTFSRFLNSYFPFYSNIINKDIENKIITVVLGNIIYEITPFSIVNLELYLPKDPEEISIKIDEENSGKKIVLGYEYFFLAKNKDNLNPRIQQTLTLI